MGGEEKTKQKPFTNCSRTDMDFLFMMAGFEFVIVLHVKTKHLVACTY